MGKLYCVCDKADEEVCKECPNSLMFKPDVKLNCSRWSRKFDLRKIARYRQAVDLAGDKI